MQKRNENKLPRSIFGAKNVLYSEQDLLEGKEPDCEEKKLSKFWHGQVGGGSDSFQELATKLNLPLPTNGFLKDVFDLPSPTYQMIN